MNTTATKKLQIRFTDQGYEQIDRLKTKSGAKNKADTIRSAIALFEIYIDHIEDGWELQFVKGDKIKTLIPIKF